jgi:uncharacterized peroxidase-related enzyme
MPRVPLLDTATASPESRAVLEQIQRAVGGPSSMFKAVAHSPAALKSLWGSFAALSQGALDAVLAQKIAVAVAERNACEYCLATHLAMGRKLGATAEEMLAARQGESGDAKTSAALRFALKLVNERGQVSDADVGALLHAGFGDADVVEIVAHVALNIFANYVNVALAVPLDFAVVKPRNTA